MNMSTAEVEKSPRSDLLAFTPPWLSRWLPSNPTQLAHRTHSFSTLNYLYFHRHFNCAQISPGLGLSSEHPAAAEEAGRFLQCSLLSYPTNDLHGRERMKAPVLPS